jgi:apolipoprotein D and lipocalin family protein
MAVQNQPSPASPTCTTSRPTGGFWSAATAVFSSPLLLCGALSLVTLSGCALHRNVPKGVEIAKNFDPLRFEGTWYELARTNHPDEAGLTRVTANYKRLPDNTWLITDRAWSNAEGRWVGSEHIAKTGKFPGSLKSRFGKPRNVVFIDSEHSMAILCSNTYRQFWIISKNPEPEPNRFDRMLALAQEAGFPVKEAIALPTR